MIETADGKHAVQAAGAVDAATTDKALLREALLGDLRTIHVSVSYLSAEKKNPALMDRFRLPDGHTAEAVGWKTSAFARIREASKKRR